MTTTAPNPRPDAATARGVTPHLAQLGRDSLYLLTGLPLAVVSFTVLVCGLSLGLTLVITLIGLPILVIALLTGRGFAAIERRRLAWVVEPVPVPEYRYEPILGQSAAAKPLARWLHVLRDGQSWLDLAHGIIVFFPAVATWSIAVIWWSVLLLGLSAPAWAPFVPHKANASIWGLGIIGVRRSAMTPWIVSFGLGAFAAVTIYPVLRGCVLLQSGLGVLLLGGRDRDLTRRIETLAARRDTATALEVDGLRRIERDLHDGPQQRLIRLDMDLAAAQRRIAAGETDTARELLAQTRVQTAEALAEIRALSRGIAPPLLADRGLGPALAALVTRTTVPTQLTNTLPDAARFSAAVESCVYFVASESLANVSKHAHAQEVWVEVAQRDGRLVLRVRDDGSGGAVASPGHGLAGLIDRARALDGELTISSPAGGPTVVHLEVPCGS